MKKFLYIFLFLLFTLFASLFIAGNSSYVIKKVADEFAPEYKITYSGITGNVLTGIKIKNVKFNDIDLAKEIKFTWDPSRIFHQMLKINDITLNDVDIDTVKALIDSFPSSDDNSTTEGSLFSIRIENIHIVVRPFIESGITVDRTIFDARSFYYAPHKLEVGSVDLKLDTNVSNINLSASLKDNVLTILNLDMNSVDIFALEHLLPAETDQKSSEINADKNDTIRKESTEDALIPSQIRIDRLHLDVLPLVFKPVHLHKLDLNITDALIETENLTAVRARIDLDGQTNLSHIVYSANVKKNRLKGRVNITPNRPLFDLYDLPIRKEAIGTVAVDLDIDRNRVVADMQAHAKHLLLLPSKDENESDRSEPFNIDIDIFKSHLVYTIEQKSLSVSSEVNISTPYADRIRVKNHFYMEKNISYGGDIYLPQITIGDDNLTEIVQDLSIDYNGTLHMIDVSLESKGIEGRFYSADLKQGLLHLETKNALELGKMVLLPEALQETELNISVDVPVDMEHLEKITSKIKMNSNLMHAKADISYDKKLSLTADITIPENSLLYQFDHHVKWSVLTPLNIRANMDEESIAAEVRSRSLSANMVMQKKEGDISGKADLSGLSVTVKGNPHDEIIIISDIDSFKRLRKTAETFYDADLIPDIDGKLNIVLEVDQEKKLIAHISSPMITYHADRTTDHVIDDVSIAVMGEGEKIEVKSYYLLYNGMALFSSRASQIIYRDGNVTISPFWLNDRLEVNGTLNTKMMQGKITAKAPIFHFSSEMIDMNSTIDIESIFDGNRTDVKGKVTILGGDVHYNLDTKTFPSDSDIIIVQDMKQQSDNPFMDHLSMLINVDTKKPLVYNEGPVNVKAMVNMGVHKAIYSDPMIIGSVDIVDGSSYLFQGKKFILEHSHIYLTGDPSKPMLDLTVKYKALKHVITIVITGTPSMPNILFSSVPSLSKEQILSLILFDSEEAAGTNDANDMMKMMGGAMAKSALNDLGVKIDHLVIGEGNSVEVGKKLTDNTTVIYINGEIPQMELKYEYSPSIEVVVGASEKSESLDIVYRKDYNTEGSEDIVIKGRR